MASGFSTTVVHGGPKVLRINFITNNNAFVTIHTQHIDRVPKRAGGCMVDQKPLANNLFLHVCARTLLPSVVRVLLFAQLIE